MKVLRSASPVLVFYLFLLLVSISWAGPLDKCSEYTKYGTPNEEGDLLCRKGFALAHDPLRKTPNWVAEHLAKKKVRIQKFHRPKFIADPLLPRSHRAEDKDYREKDCKKLECQRGHMAPAADMKWSKKAFRESFYLSNAVLQNGSMNRGIWSMLESRVRDWAKTRGELYVYTGPIYNSNIQQTIGRGRVAVPAKLYKIIFDPIRLEAIAFIVENEEPRDKELAKKIVTIDQVEAETGLDFFSMMDDEIEQLMESRKATALWR